MRTETKIRTLFTFDELSERAKQKAIEREIFANMEDVQSVEMYFTDTVHIF